MVVHIPVIPCPLGLPVFVNVISCLWVGPKNGLSHFSNIMHVNVAPQIHNELNIYRSL